MDLDWKLIRSIWVALAIPALIVAVVWAWPLGIEKWERSQKNAQVRKCEDDVKTVLGHELNAVEAAEVLRWCLHRADGGLFNHDYRPLLPSVWKEYYARRYPHADPCKAHPALC